MADISIKEIIEETSRAARFDRLAGLVGALAKHVERQDARQVILEKRISDLEIENITLG